MKIVSRTLAMILIAGTAFAQGVEERSIGFLDESWNFDKGKIYSAWSLMSESEWKSLAASEHLNLFPQFRSLKNLDPVSGDENLEVFQSEMAFVANPATALAYFQSHSAVEILAAVDPGFSHQALDSVTANQLYQDDLLEGYQGAQNTLSQRQSRQVDPISPSSYEVGLGVLQQQLAINQSVQWCSEPNTECIRSRARFEGTWQGLFEVIQAFPSESLMKVPSEINLLAEARVLTSNLEVGQDLMAGGQPVDALVVRGFWANSLIQFYHLRISLHPISGNELLVVLRSSVAFERDDLDKLENGFLSARSLLLGRSIYNGDVGFSMGLPLIQQQMVQELAGKLGGGN